MTKLYAKIKGARAISLFDFPKTWQVCVRVIWNWICYWDSNSCLLNIFEVFGLNIETNEKKKESLKISHLNILVCVWIIIHAILYSTNIFEVGRFKQYFFLKQLLNLPYFFSYKTEFFSFQNNPKNLDPSYKMDLDVWDYLGIVKLVL